MDASFIDRENPFLEVLPGLKKPKPYYRKFDTTHRKEYCEKPLNPPGPFLPAKWKGPDILFENKTTFQVGCFIKPTKLKLKLIEIEDTTAVKLTFMRSRGRFRICCIFFLIIFYLN